MQLFRDETRDLIQVIRNQVVAPLHQFQGVASHLDEIHTGAYHKFVNNLKSLFIGNPPPIQGGGADALWQKIEEYVYSEQPTTGQGHGDISIIIEKASTYCKRDADIISDLCDIYPFYDIIAPPFDIPLPIYTSQLDITKHINTPDVLYMIYEDQLALLYLMGEARVAWGCRMTELYNDFSLERLLPDAPNNLPIAFVSLPPVNLTGVEQQQVTTIMDELASLGLSNIPQQYIEELISEGFSKQDILNAIIGWQAAGMTPQQISDALFLAAFNILLGPYYRTDMVPKGMTPTQYQNFLSTLRSGLNDAGICAGAGVGGSAVTGYKYTTGQPFDSNPDKPSDYDIVLSSDSLFTLAQSLKIKIYEGTHTGELTEEQLKELGLWNLAQNLRNTAGREVHFQIYNALTTTSARAPYIYFFGNSCAQS